MQSPFLYLHQQKQVLPIDKERYEEANSNLYKKEGWRFLCMCFLAKLYDISSLPIPRNRKMYIYIGLIGSISSMSFYRSSLQLVDLLEQLDNKYKQQFDKYTKEHGYQGIA